jgi:hypothetical protein
VNRGQRLVGRMLQDGLALRSRKLRNWMELVLESPAALLGVWCRSLFHKIQMPRIMVLVIVLHFARIVAELARAAYCCVVKLESSRIGQVMAA